jgi:choline dehydrogenase
VCGFINSDDFSAVPDIQLDVSVGNYGDRRMARHPVLKVGFYQLKPRSRGFVHASSRDIQADPVIQPAYLSDELDQQVAVDGLKAVRRLLKAPALQPYYVSELLPGPYVEDDRDCLEYARTTGLTGHHVCGSCKMGPRRERMAVVDHELRVHGLEGLRIADASIMPSVPSANTSAAVFMIAEKASDIMLERNRSDPVVRNDRMDTESGSAHSLQSSLTEAAE